MSYIITSPFPSFNDTDGSPLNNGYVYVGSANLNPVTDPIPVYWDEALTQPAAQPIRTINGYLSRNGSPGRIYTAFVTYSLRVTNNKGALVFSDLNYRDPSASAGSTYQQVITAISGQTVFNLSRTYIPGTNNLFVYRNGLRLIAGEDYAETGYSQITLTAGADNGDEFVFDIGYNYDTAANIDAQDVTYKLPAVDSVFTNVEEKLSQIINVKDFGAVGDGTTDDTAAFTAAAAYSSPVQVSVPVGTYLLNSSPVASSSVSWLVDSGATFTGAGSLTSSGAKYLPLENLNDYRNSLFAFLVGGGLPANLTGAGTGGIEIGAGTEQCPRGMMLGCDGAANWLAAQVAKNENPTELILYSSSAQGYATTNAGTNQITKAWGSDFQTRWIGNTIYFLRKKFKVASVPSTTTLTVTEMDGSPVSFVGSETEAFNYFYTSGSGICNVSGTTVTFVSGDPFVPLFFTDFSFTLNGVARTVSAFVSPTEYTLSSAPGNATGIPFTWQGNINDQITTLRVQSIQGANEENLNLMSIAGDNFLGRYFTVNTGIAGIGKYRPFFIGTGVYTDFSYQHQVGVYPRDFLGGGNQGYVSLGGVQGREGMRVYSPNASTPTANFISTQGAATTVAPSFRAEGTDTNIPFGIDTKGSGEFRITQSFARTIFKAQGAGATVNWLNAVASAAGAPVEFYASGSDANINVKITPKGTGTVILTNLPTSSAGLPSGGLWRDAGAGNVVKIVP